MTPVPALPLPTAPTKPPQASSRRCSRSAPRTATPLAVPVMPRRWRSCTAPGLRRSEAVSLELTDFDRETGALTVCGKGRKERTAYLDAGAREAIAVWLEYRGSERGPLLTPITRSGNVLIRPLTAQAVRKAMRRRSDAAGLREFTPHDLRRSFISHLLDRGADIATVQRMAGHAQVTTTARYDRRGEEAKQKASALLAVPFRRPERRP